MWWESKPAYERESKPADFCVEWESKPVQRALVINKLAVSLGLLFAF